MVSRDGDGYELVAGHRRVLAARVAGKTTIPAVIRDDDVRDRLELAPSKTCSAPTSIAIETARAYKLLMETYDLTQEQVAERVGKSRSQVANMLPDAHRATASPGRGHGGQDQRGPPGALCCRYLFRTHHRTCDSDREAAVGAGRGGARTEDGPPATARAIATAFARR